MGVDKMKRFLVILIVLCLVLSLAVMGVGCSRGTCEVCRQTEKLRTYKHSSGERYRVCDFCYQMFKFIGP